MFNLTSEEVGRISQISFVLEPIAEKPGLTTRTKDLNSNLKLENFLVAGINVGKSFEKLAQRILSIDIPNKLPVTYDLFLDDTDGTTQILDNVEENSYTPEDLLLEVT